jgi:hypothetical protein
MREERAREIGSEGGGKRERRDSGRKGEREGVYRDYVRVS